MTGLGKTYTSLTLATQIMLRYKDVVTIIICPPKALASFEKELTNKLKVTYTILSTEKTYVKKDSRFIVISNTCLDKYAKDIIDISKTKKILGIVDECHLGLQSPDSKLYKLFVNLRKCFSILYFLTATTCKNNIIGMYHMITLLDPRILGSYSDFKRNYLIMNKRTINQTVKGGRKIKRTQEELVGYRNIEQLKNILANLVIVRQKKYNLVFNYHRVQPNEKETNAYLNASAGKMSEKAEDFWSVRLRDISLVVDNVHENYEQEELSKKEELFLKQLKFNLYYGNPTIVYCCYISVQERLEYLMNKYKQHLGIDEIFVIKGGVSLETRKKIEKEIDINKPCIITDAGGESINLQRANSIIFYDLPYDISKFMQIVGRITRVDTKFDHQNIDIIELFGTTDTYKRLCLEKNMKLVESLFGKMNTLPITTYDNDQRYMSVLRKTLLWAFTKRKMVTEEELDSIFNKYEKE